MIQQEKVKFRITERLPNPKEVDYWIDLRFNKYGGCIRYYCELTDTWEMLDTDYEFQLLVLALEDRLEELEKSLDVLESLFNYHVNESSERFSNIETNVSNLLLNVASILSSVYDILSEISNLKQTITNILNTINNIEGSIEQGPDMSGVQGLIDALNLRLQQLESRIDGLQPGGDTSGLSERLTLLESKVDALEDRVDNLPSGGGSTGGTDTALTARVAALESKYDDLNGKYNLLQSLYETLKGLIESGAGSGSGDGGNYTELTLKVGELESKYNTVNSTLDSHIQNHNNPHVTTREHLHLGENEEVKFKKLTTTAGFFKED